MFQALLRMPKAEAKLQRSSSRFVFLILDIYDNHQFSIQQVKRNENGDSNVQEPFELVQFNVQFNEPEDGDGDEQEVEWFFSPPASSTGDMYVLPKWPAGAGKPKNAYQFNFKTCDFRKITPPLSPKWNGNAVNLDGRLYFMEQPKEELYLDGRPDFECYDPVTDSWEALEPFPNPPRHSRILATAVWNKTILFNVANLSQSGCYSLRVDSCSMWAYDVSRNAWYPVDNGDDERCCSIKGEAAVMGNTLYALTSLDSDSLLALSIKKKERVHGPKFTCSVVSHITVQGMTPEFFHDEIWTTSRQLVHLRKDDFCLVQTCLPVGKIEYQPISLTYIKREGKHSMHLTHVQNLKVKHGGCFDLLHAFSLPKGMTTVLEEGDMLDFPLDPCPDTSVSTQEDNSDSDDSDSDNTDSDLDDIDQDLEPTQEDNSDSDNTDSDSEPEVVKPVQEDENLTLPTVEEGHSIHVKNLPSDVNDAQLEVALKIFGPVKSIGIKVVKLMGRKHFYANVVFESATSKQRAIEASTIEIGGRQAKIFDRTPLPSKNLLADYNGTSSSFGKNKFKNCGEVS